MTFEELDKLYGLQENANETEHELQEADFFSEYFAKKFTISVLPIESKDDPGYFCLVVDVESKGAKLSEEHAEEICDAVNEKFFELISSVKSEDDVDTLTGQFIGVEFYLNGTKLY